MSIYCGAPLTSPGAFRVNSLCLLKKDHGGVWHHDGRLFWHIEPDGCVFEFDPGEDELSN